MTENTEELNNPATIHETRPMMGKKPNYALFGVISAIIYSALIWLSSYSASSNQEYDTPLKGLYFTLAFYAYISLIALTGAGFASRKMWLNIVNACLIVALPAVTIMASL